MGEILGTGLNFVIRNYKILTLDNFISKEKKSLHLPYANRKNHFGNRPGTSVMGFGIISVHKGKMKLIYP